MSPKSYAIECGERLRLAREAAGYTQDEFTRLLDLKPQRIPDYEAGRNRLTMDGLKAIHDKTGITPDWLLLGDPDKLPDPIKAAIHKAKRG